MCYVQDIQGQYSMRVILVLSVLRAKKHTTLTLPWRLTQHLPEMTFSRIKNKMHIKSSYEYKCVLKLDSNSTMEEFELRIVAFN